jgi:hypothetical protein
MRNLTLIAAICGSLTFATAAEAHSRINQRQYDQHQRIAQGVHSGSLTRREAYHLKRDQARIAQYEAQSRRDGRGLTRHERARIEAMQDRASGRISWQKRDWQRR